MIPLFFLVVTHKDKAGHRVPCQSAGVPAESSASFLDDAAAFWKQTCERACRHKAHQVTVDRAEGKAA